MKNCAKNLCSFARGNKIYIIILLIFLIVFAYGKNIIVPEGTQTFSQSDNSIKDAKDFYVMDNQDAYTKIENVLSSQAGDYYRIKFVAQVVPNIQRIAANSNEKGVEYDYLNARYPYNISLKLVSRSGQEQKVSDFAITDQAAKYYEFSFKADSNYNDAVFSKGNFNDMERVSFSQFFISRLGIRSDAELAKLKPTIQTIDNVDNVPILPQDQPSSMIALSTPGQRAGELFTAGGDYLSGACVYLDAVGNGGLGDYKLSLYAEDATGENDAVSTLRFLVADFNLYQYQGNFYRLPLAANLVKGHRYYLVVSNISAIVNKSNYLNVGLWQDQESNKSVTANLGVSALQGQSYIFQESMQAEKSHNGDPLTIDSTIEDLGAGVGGFSYRSQAKSYDVLVPQPSSLIGFDQTTKAITFGGNQQELLVYRFNTVYNINSLHFELKQAMGQYPRVKVKYSWDSKTWNEVFPLEGISPYLFSGDMTPRGSVGNNFYLSISAKDDPADYSNPFFEIYDLKVGAQLNLE